MESEKVPFKIFLNFVFRNIKKYQKYAIILVILFSVFYIFFDILIPVYLVRFINDLFLNNLCSYSDVSAHIGLLALLCIALYYSIFIIEDINKTYLNDLKIRLHRNLIEFFIIKKVDITEKNNDIIEISENIVVTFYRMIHRLIPFAVTLIFLLLLFAKNNFIYFITISLYIICTYMKAQRVSQTCPICGEKQYTDNHNITDKYIDTNAFMGSESEANEYMNKFNIETILTGLRTKKSHKKRRHKKLFSRQEDIVQATHLNIFEILPQHAKMFVEKKSIDYVLILINLLIYVALNINDVLSVNTLIFFFLHYKVILLTKLIFNYNLLNISSTTKIQNIVETIQK